ncbi:hypothetical protein VCRA2119O147_1600008 [Vibrio crassostreae]|nr:hypothetical protein VCHA50P424_220051 [Vibrio chagasii]CAK1901448.1 hypothetical protein VCRA2112O187_210053 [Vibrio crassostreae]CAH7186430.1 hypothetical protein VCHA50O407_290008 [Vibrio chagasii]CAH7228155.1 hypothetical protein VCHA43P273_330048 [Vibrio chagasii]CAK1927173.1 hypothetical protein VCRA2119O47_240008 [Vibrio crassostreae]
MGLGDYSQGRNVTSSLLNIGGSVIARGVKKRNKPTEGNAHSLSLGRTYRLIGIVTGTDKTT